MKVQERITHYVERVLSGELPSCKMVKLACERFMSDLRREDLSMDWMAVKQFDRFAHALKHFKGEKAGTPIRLEDWQLFIAANIFGLHRKDTGTRKYTYADVVVPRKNGKTTFAAIVALFLLLLDDEPGAEIYAAAVDREQAKICFDAAKNLIKGSVFETLAQSFRASVVVESTASAFKPLSKDTKNKDGLNPHGAVCDERHAWSTNEIYEVLKTGMGARRQPLIFSITTAGTDTSLPYYRDLDVLRDIVRGVKKKDNHFIMIYEPDDEDDWQDPLVWRKVNPNYGISLSERYIQEEFEEARMRGGTTLAAFQTKNLNKWVDAPDVWIADEDVVACNGDYDLQELKGQEVYVGIDLASKSDLSATALFFPESKVCRFIFCIPEAKVAELEDRVDYRLWQEQGWVTVTPGKLLDEDWFVEYIIGVLAPYKVKAIAYDPWGMWNITQKFRGYQEQLVAYQQSIKYMSVPTKELESMTLRHELNFLHNPVIRWNYGNVVLYRDPNANVKLDKARSRNKIDGVVALVDAVGAWLNAGAKEGEGSIYTDHTLRVVPHI